MHLRTNSKSSVNRKLYQFTFISLLNSSIVGKMEKVIEKTFFWDVYLLVLCTSQSFS